MKCECISDFFPRFSTWCEGSECGGIHNQPVSFQNATPAFEWQVEWMTREPGLDCVVICWRGKGSHYWNANQTVWETMCVFRLLVCVWTVSMRFWRCLCVFVSAFVYWTTVGDPIVSSFLLTVSFKCQTGENICSLRNNSLHFYTSNETNGVEKLADWLIIVVSTHAHKPKQLILCLLGAGLMVGRELWFWGLSRGRDCGVLNTADSLKGVCEHERGD